MTYDKNSFLKGFCAALALGRSYLVGLISKFINRNGTYRAADDGAEGYSMVVVDVSPELTPADEGKVVENGALVAQTSLTVTQNGTYNTTKNNVVVVNVSGGGGDDPFVLTDYIESSGTQFINTGYSVKDNSVFEVLATPATTQQVYSAIFGTRASNGDTPQTLSCVLWCTWGGSSTPCYVNWGSNAIKITSADKGNKTLYRMTKLKCTVLDGNSIDDVIGFAPINSTYSATTAPLFLFTLGVNGIDYGTVCHCSMKLYRVRIWEGNTLVMELLPYVDNGEACMRDTISGNLYKNIGTGAFTYGTD